ncbi:MAG: TonB-dependent receptor [Gammaproteobacteria bacterium]|nr:TonB-dependent receptor [Gammaproteobacteria bacterium]
MNTSRHRFAFFTALFLAPVFSVTVLADTVQLPELPSFTDDDFLSGIPVVLTATRLAQPLSEAPAAMTVIDREMINASGARDVAHLFRLVPGFMVSQDNGHMPIVAYHGLTSEYVNRLQVLVDGRSVYSPLFGGADWSNLPLVLDDIERIEVIRGPNAASYGSNSFLSVINIITRHASETTGQFFRATRGSNGIKNGVYRFGDSTQNADYRLTLASHGDSGLVTRADDHRIHNLRGRADMQLSERDTLLLQTGISKGMREIDSMSLNAVEDRKILMQFEQVRWQHQIGANDALSVQFFHTLEDTDEVFDVTIQPPLGRIIRNASNRAERFDLEVQHTLQLSPQARLVWGGGLRQDSAQGPQIFNTNPATMQTGNNRKFYNKVFRSFANIETRLRTDLTLNTGAMLEKSTLAATALSPRIGANYFITPQQSVRLIYSQATRTPSLNEARSNYRIPVEGPPSFITTVWVGNPQLKVEKITSYELGYHANLNRQRTVLDIKAYHEHLRDLITVEGNSVSDPSDLLDRKHFVYDNLTDADITGLEIALDIRPTRHTRFVLSHSSNKIKSTNPNISSAKLAQSSPKHITSLLAIARLPGGFNSSISYYSVSKSNGLGSGDGVKRYKTANLRLAYPFTWGSARGEISWVYENLGGDYKNWRQDNTMTAQHYVSIFLYLD